MLPKKAPKNVGVALPSGRGGNRKDFECVNENLKGFKEAEKGRLMALREANHESVKENEGNIVRNEKKEDS